MLNGCHHASILNRWKIIADPNLLEDGDPVLVKRTWPERLFSWPWNPFRGLKTVTPKVPSGQVYRLGDDILIMHPVTLEKIREAMG